MFPFRVLLSAAKSWRIYCGRIVALKGKIVFKNCSMVLKHSEKPVNQRVCKTGELLLKVSDVGQILQFLLVLW